MSATEYLINYWWWIPVALVLMALVSFFDAVGGPQNVDVNQISQGHKRVKQSGGYRKAWKEDKDAPRHVKWVILALFLFIGYRVFGG